MFCCCHHNAVFNILINWNRVITSLDGFCASNLTGPHLSCIAYLDRMLSSKMADETANVASLLAEWVCNEADIEPSHRSFLTIYMLYMLTDQ